MSPSAQTKTKNSLFDVGQSYSFPTVLLTCALIVELLFVSIMVVTMVYSEKQVRTTLERQVRLERLQGDILQIGT